MTNPMDKRERQRSHRHSLRYEFGRDVLVHQRKKLGLNQENVGKRAKVNRYRIIRIERGAQVKDPDEFVRLIHAYQLNSQLIKRWIDIEFGETILRFILKALRGA